MINALAALVEAMRAGITNPADQVRVLLALAGFTFEDGTGGSIGIGAAMAAMRDAMTAACRRAALVSLARASASYQPVSYDDAAALRLSLAAALDTEITVAGDAGEDASYLALKALRSAVVQDLTVRGASLPSVVTVVLGLPMPALAVAQFLYQDASRSDGIAAESGAIHPAFCPVTFQALASGTGPTVNPSYDLASGASSSIAVMPTPSVGVYQLPCPNAPLNLTVVSTTSSAAVLSWAAATSGGLAASYGVQVSPHAAGIWSTAATVTATVTGSTVTGLSRDTAYDFQVFASNATGTGSASAIATGTTTAAAPNAVGSLACGTVTANTVALSWTGSVLDSTHDAAASYAVQYRVTGSGPWLAGPSGITGTSASVTGLAHATGYDFLVIAINSGGSAASSVANATTTAAAPIAPASLSVAPVPDGTTTKLAASWAASAVDSTHDAATAYTVQISPHGAGTWTTVYAGSGTSCTASGLSVGTSYDVQVTASNGGGAGGRITATGSTFSTVMSWHTAPASSYAHGSGGNAVNAYTTPNPSGSVGVDFWWSASAADNTEAFGPSTSRTTGGTDNGYPIWTNVWGAYLNAPTAPGTYYVWALVHDGSGGLVSAAVAVT